MRSSWGIFGSLVLSAIVGSVALGYDSEALERKIVQVKDDTVITANPPSDDEVDKHRKRAEANELEKALETEFDDLAGDQWNQVAEGLFLGGFLPKKDYSNGQEVREELNLNYPIVVLKVDLDQYDLKLFSNSELNDGWLRNAEEWVREFGMVAAINAGMYQEDYRTNVGYMKNSDHVNSAGVVSHYRSAIAFNPKSEDSPKAQIIDLQLDSSLASAKNRYDTVIQGLRMITSRQTNAWKQSHRIWSTAAFGFDQEGNALIIHSRTPYSVYDFNNILLSIPELNIKNVQYCEGGPESSIFIKVDQHTLRSVGSYETGFYENDGNDAFWDLPNALGIVPKSTESNSDK